MSRKKPAVIVILALFFCTTSLFAQGPCSSQSNKLACVIPQEYGSKAFDFTGVLYDVGFHPTHFNNGPGDIQNRLAPLTTAIGREANLLPLASPSSGVVLTYDPALKTLVVSTDSLGPVLGERGETVGKHRLFVGFSYQFFNFDKIDSVNLRSFPAFLTHTDDRFDNAPVNCSSTISSANNIGACAFVRDAVQTVNSIDLRINQYTTYVTFGLTNRVDLSMVLPVENVRMGVTSQATIVLGESGFWMPVPGTLDATTNLNQNNPPNGPPTNGAPYFFHLFKNCPNTSPPAGASALDPVCLNHKFPDPAFTGSGSNSVNSASGIGDIVARVKWNAWSGERIKFAAGLDLLFPTGDAANYLGSGAYGVKPFVVASYRARISPHVLVGYEWNSHSILGPVRDPNSAPNIVSGQKGYVPSEFIYAAGADAWVTKWLTGSFDVIGQRLFRAGTESVTPQQFLAPCPAACTAAPNPNTVTYNNLTDNANASYSITNASIGLKVRPFGKVSKLVLTANALVRLDEGGLHSKVAPLFGIGYTF